MDFSNFELIFESFNNCSKVNDYKYVWKNPNNNDYYVERKGIMIIPYEDANEETIQTMLDCIWLSGYSITKINGKYNDFIKQRFNGKYDLK